MSGYTRKPVSPNVETAQRRRRAAVVLLSLTIVLLVCVQGMLVMFATRDRARLAQIRELTRRIAEERAEDLHRESSPPNAQADRMRFHRSAPARTAAPLIGAEDTVLRDPLVVEHEAVTETSSPGNPRAGLGHLVDLANFMARERRASLVEWRGRLAILYQKIDPTAQDPLWEILNVLSDLKLLDGVTVVTGEEDAARANELRKSLLEFGISPDRLRLGRKAEHGEVFTGVLISTSAAI